MPAAGGGTTYAGSHSDWMSAAGINPADWSAADGWSTATTTCAAAPAEGATAPQATLQVQARVIAQ